MGTKAKQLLLGMLSFLAMQNKMERIPVISRTKTGRKYTSFRGGRKSAASSDACIYIPKRKKFKGYLRND